MSTSVDCTGCTAVTHIEQFIDEHKEEHKEQRKEHNTLRTDVTIIQQQIGERASTQEKLEKDIAKIADTVSALKAAPWQLLEKLILVIFSAGVTYLLK